jgi:hypothetical protein
MTSLAHLLVRKGKAYRKRKGVEAGVIPVQRPSGVDQQIDRGYW